MSVANMQRKIRIDIIFLSCVLNITCYRGHFKREILEFFHTFFELWGINKYRVINMIKQNVNWEYLGTENTCNLIYWFKKITPACIWFILHYDHSTFSPLSYILNCMSFKHLSILTRPWINEPNKLMH